MEREGLKVINIPKFEGAIREAETTQGILAQ
jgi:hypothetical protein